MIKTVGIIGLGSFGRFLATLMPPEVRVLGSSRTIKQLDGVEIAPLEEVAQCDVVILGMTLSAYPEVLQKLAPLLPRSTLLIDVCSVKLKPEELIKTYLPNHENILSTHPLFGPQSAATGTKGLKLIVTREGDKKAGAVLDYYNDALKLDVIRMSADEHDQIMARVHALTFFVSRALANMNLKEEPFMTPSYQKIMDMVAFNNTHSDDIFQTIEQGNPYAQLVRRQLLEAFSATEAQITDATN